LQLPITHKLFNRPVISEKIEAANSLPLWFGQLIEIITDCTQEAEYLSASFRNGQLLYRHLIPLQIPPPDAATHRLRLPCPIRLDSVPHPASRSAVRRHPRRPWILRAESMKDSRTPPGRAVIDMIKKPVYDILI